MSKNHSLKNVLLFFLNNMLLILTQKKTLQHGLSIPANLKVQKNKPKKPLYDHHPPYKENTKMKRKGPSHSRIENAQVRGHLMYPPEKVQMG